MSLKNIKIDIYFNDEKLIKVEYLSPRKIIYHLDNRILKRKEVKNIHYLCNTCSDKVILKNIPENSTLYKDNIECKKCRNLEKKNPMYGKKMSEEEKYIRSLKMSGKNNPMYGKKIYDVWKEKYGKLEADKRMLKYKEKHSNNNTGKNNSMYGKKFYDIWVEKYSKEEADKKLNQFKNKHKTYLLKNPDQHNKMIINSHKKRYRMTSIERKLYEYFELNGFDFKYNFILDNKYQFDFLIKDKNLIIEAHGDYWHGNPNIYSNIDKDKKQLNEQQLYKQDLDDKKYKYVNINTNYTIKYLWETDIKNDNFKKIIKSWNL